MLTKSAAAPQAGRRGRRPAAGRPPSGAARGLHGGPRRGRGRPAGEELRGAQGTKPAPPWRVVAGRTVAAAGAAAAPASELAGPLEPREEAGGGRADRLAAQLGELAQEPLLLVGELLGGLHGELDQQVAAAAAVGVGHAALAEALD